jgi:AraC-like DNA-binding protein
MKFQPETTNIAMKFRTFKPAGLLSGIVDYYWIVDHPDNRSVYREMVYPQGFLQMMFYFGQRFTQRDAHGNTLLLPRSCLCGLKERFVHVEVAAGFGVMGVVFHPHSARQVIGIPLNEFRGLNIPLSDWLGQAGKELEERIFRSGCHHDRIAILEAFLLGRLAEPTCDQRRIAGCIRSITRAPSVVSLKELATMACLSERQFERSFAAVAGTSPKQYQRIARLNHAIGLAGRNRSENLTSIALSSGYYDQAHFNNEFREMTGLTPRQLLGFNHPGGVNEI